MSKGAWSVLVYPESADIRACVDLFVGTGAEYSYILHDKDKDKDGNPKKPHYHLTLGWMTGCPGFGKLRQMCKACGAVAVSEQACTVHDGEACEEYELHKNAPDKYQYSEDERVRSDAFYMGDYITADEKRTRRRADKKKAAKSDLAAFMASIMEIVSEQELDDFAALAQYCNSSGAVDMGMFWENSVRVKAYVDSARYMNAQSARMELETMTKKAKQQQHAADQYAAQADHYRDALHQACEELERLQRSVLTYWERVHGDTACAIWEVDYSKPFWEEWLKNET